MVDHIACRSEEQRLKSLREMLDRQELIVGLTAQNTCAPWLAKVYANAGADFICIENEHHMYNGAGLSSFILTSRLCGMPVVSKSSYVDRGDICKLLDAGVTGIQLPMSESAGQLAEAISYVKFPPEGVRAAGLGIGNTDYNAVDLPSWVKQANRDTVVIAHIETRKGVENIDEILETPGVDLMFIGPADLSISMGHPGDYSHPDIARAMDTLISAALRHGKIAGTWAPTYEAAKPWIDRGVRFFETMGEVGLAARGAAEVVSGFPGHGAR